MDSEPRGADWRSILTAIFGLGGTLLALSSAIGIFAIFTINKNVSLNANVSPLGTILTASTLVAIGLLLLPVTWLSIKRLRGADPIALNLPALKLWNWLVIPAAWLLIVTLAALFYDAPGALWYVPFLHFLSIAIPLYFMIRIAINRIPLGSRQRAWGVFSVGMTVSPALAIVAEIIMLFLGILVILAFLGFNPDKIAEIERMVNRIQRAPDMDRVIYMIGPLLKNPLTLLGALSFLSFLVPIIEESAKSLGIWLVSGRLQTPAQGFAIGVLSGAGFALAESLSASLTADDTWGLTLAMRAVSGSMHMLASGLFGWGIASARLEKRYFRLIGMALLAMLLHSAWNAGAVFTIWGGIRVMLVMPDFDLPGVFTMIGGIGLLLLMLVGMVVSYFVLNARFRASIQTAPSLQEG